MPLVGAVGPFAPGRGPGGPEGRRERSYDAFNLIVFGAPAPDVPFLRNYYNNERLYQRLTAYLATHSTADVRLRTRAAVAASSVAR